jgi:hypothetical protein
VSLKGPQTWPHPDLQDDAFAPPVDASAPAAFVRLLTHLGRGEPLDHVALHQVAHACGIDTDLCHRKRDSREALDYPRPDLLLRIGSNLRPDLVGCAPDWALGAWADALILDDPAHTQARVHACALVALSDVQPPDPPLIRRHLRREMDSPTTPYREGLARLLETPQGLWLLDQQDGDRWQLTDLLELHPTWSPEEPVDLHAVPSVEGGSPQKGDTLCARLVDTPSGPQAWIGLRVSSHPSLDQIRGWRLLCLLVARLKSPNLPLEIALARQGHRLMRYLHEWAWTR